MQALLMCSGLWFDVLHDTVLASMVFTKVTYLAGVSSHDPIGCDVTLQSFGMLLCHTWCRDIRLLQGFLTSAISKKPVLLDRVRHGDVLIANWWRDEGKK